MTYLRGFGQRVQPHQIDLQRSLLLHGQRQRQVAEGVKGHRDLGTHGTHQRGLEQAVKYIDDDGVVPLDVVLPGLLRHHLQDIQRKNITLETLDLNHTHVQTIHEEQNIGLTFLKKCVSDVDLSLRFHLFEYLLQSVKNMLLVLKKKNAV